VRGDDVMVVEANPRASRTIPYLSKAIGVPLAKLAALVAAGKTLDELGFTATPRPKHYSVKEVVLPFLKFRGVAPFLGPEMRSTGESMGIDDDPYLAYYRAALGAGAALPRSGRARLIGDGVEAQAAKLAELGFDVVRGPLPSGSEPDYALLIDTEHTPEARRALENGVPYVTTAEAANWTVNAMAAAAGALAGANGALPVRALQDLG